MSNYDKKGAILFIVIAIVLVVVILSTVVLRVTLNHASITHHQVTRIQAQYAARAGMVYALEMLRTGVWTYPGSCSDPTGCVVTDTNFPLSVNSQQFRIIFCPSGSTCQNVTCNPPAGSNFCINSNVAFTYVP